QRLAERVDAAWRLVQPRASEQGITLTNEVEDDHRTPPMFPAEITSVLLNLMTNAIKAAGDNGRIITRSESHSEGSVVFTMENTGDAVDLTESEVWFRPFESTTAQADPVLGTGMGLGLPIVRRILEEVGARVRFVSPTSSPFTTAVEITFPAS
ncbi:MAG: ATP-binding protein, partial [Pseudomonadota bacterium]